MLNNQIKLSEGFLVKAVIWSVILFAFSCTESELVLPEEDVALEEIPTATPTVGSKFYIRNRNSGRYLEIENGSNSNGADLQQGTTSVSSTQTHKQWEIIDTGSGYVRLKGVDSGKSIEARGGSNANGTKIEQRSYSGVTHQQWQLISTGGGYYRIKSRDSGKSIAIVNGSTSNGADAEARSWDGSTKFQWLFEEVNGSSNGGGNDGGSNCSSAACVISGSTSNFSKYWKLNGFSGSLNIGSGSYGRDGSNGLDYEDRASTSDNSNWFFDTNGYAAFKCHVGNPTSSGSGNMRSELREMDGNGNEIEWDGTNNVLHRMTYKVQVRQLPSSGKVCFGQIHGSGSFDDVIRVQLEDPNADRGANSGSGSGTFNVTIKGYVTEVLNPGVRNNVWATMRMDQEYTVEITMQNKRVRVLLNGSEIFDTNDDSSDVNSRDNYFKAGTYLQSAQSSKSPRLNRHINNFGEVWIKDMNVSHN